MRLLPFKFTDQNPVSLFPASQPVKTLCVSSLQVNQSKPCVSSLQVNRSKPCVLLPFNATGQNPVFLPSSQPVKTLCISSLQVNRSKRCVSSLQVNRSKRCVSSLQVNRPKPCVFLPFKSAGQNPVCFFPSSQPVKTLCASSLQGNRSKPCALHFHCTCYILSLLILDPPLWECPNCKYLVPRFTTRPIINRTGRTLYSDLLWIYTQETR
jgi:hypothetical protein